MCRAIEPLPHIDALLAGTRGSSFFTKLDLASSNPSAPGAASGLLEVELPVAAGPVRVECRAPRPAGGLVTAKARDESGTHCAAGLSRRSEHGPFAPNLNATTGPHVASRGGVGGAQRSNGAR